MLERRAGGGLTLVGTGNRLGGRCGSFCFGAGWVFGCGYVGFGQKPID